MSAGAEPVAAVSIMTADWTRRFLACAFCIAVLGACSANSDALPVDVAEANLRAALADSPSTWAIPERVSATQYARDAVLRSQLTSMRDKGLIELVDDGQGVRIRLTQSGERFRMEPDPNRRGTIVVRTGVRVLDRVDTIDPLKTNQGVKVRDTAYTWHYTEVTPFGEALGLKPNQPSQSRSAAVRMGDKWRFVEL